MFTRLLKNIKQIFLWGGQTTLTMCSMYALRCQSNACGFQQKIDTLSSCFSPSFPNLSHLTASLSPIRDVDLKLRRNPHAIIWYMYMLYQPRHNKSHWFIFFFPDLILCPFKTFVPGGILIIWSPWDSYLGGRKTGGIDGHSILRNPRIFYRTWELLWQFPVQQI